MQASLALVALRLRTRLFAAELLIALVQQAAQQPPAAAAGGRSEF
jgi:hypothetical protein